MYWTDSTDWREIAHNIEHERMFQMDKRRPLPSDIGVMLYNMEHEFKSGIDTAERKDMAELLYQIYIELNLKEPIGRDYKQCFTDDNDLINQFIEVFKMVNEGFTVYYEPVLKFLEDFKKHIQNGSKSLDNVSGNDEAKMNLLAQTRELNRRFEQTKSFDNIFNLGHILSGGYNTENALNLFEQIAEHRQYHDNVLEILQKISVINLKGLNKIYNAKISTKEMPMLSNLKTNNDEIIAKQIYSIADKILETSPKLLPQVKSVIQSFENTNPETISYIKKEKHETWRDILFNKMAMLEQASQLKQMQNVQGRK